MNDVYRQIRYHFRANKSRKEWYNMAKICAIYVRKSKVNDNSDSMETQIQMCTEYLERKY